MKINEMVQRILEEAGRQIGGDVGSAVAALNADALLQKVRPDRNLPPSAAGETMMKVSMAMPEIADRIEQIIAEVAGGRVPFALWVFTEGRMSYISSVEREQVAEMMKGVLSNWSAGAPDIPAHKVN